MERQCAKCKKVKYLTEYHKSKQDKHGYKTECKECRNKYSKQKRVEAGGTNHIDRSTETDLLKICTKCKELKDRKGFNSSVWCNDCNRTYHREKYGYIPRIIPIITDKEKQCTTCKVLKPFSEFSPSIRGKLKLASSCKPCTSLYIISKTSKEERRIKTQLYRNSNREWWRSLHRINQFNRKNLVKAVSDGTVTPEFVKTVYNLTDCYYCKEEIPRKFRTLEHKQPLKKGGLHSINNITMACSTCNNTKGKMTELEFIKYKNATKQN